MELLRDPAFGDVECLPLPAQPGALKAKILVCHGAVAPHVKSEAVRGFLEEMEAVGADYQPIMYAGAVHVFTQKAAADDPSRGVAYNAQADRRGGHGQLPPSGGVC